TGPAPELAVVNRGVVELETARAAGISVRIAEDLANVIDDGATRRVLPVIGKGALQNITDLKLLRGIDWQFSKPTCSITRGSKTCFLASKIGRATSARPIMRSFSSSRGKA